MTGSPHRTVDRKLLLGRTPGECGGQRERVDSLARGHYTVGMEVRFTPEQVAQLSQLASSTGKNAEQVVQEAVDRLLNETRFTEGVQAGFASLDRGEYLEHDEVKARIERLLRS
jgi:predicted transcriptional regulator